MIDRIEIVTVRSSEGKAGLPGVQPDGRNHFTVTVSEDGVEVHYSPRKDPFATVRIELARPTLGAWFRGIWWGHGPVLAVTVRGDAAASELIFGAADPKSWAVPGAPADVLRQERLASRDPGPGRPYQGLDEVAPPSSERSVRPMVVAKPDVPPAPPPAWHAAPRRFPLDPPDPEIIKKGG